ncbi:MAG TPA: ATP-binding protein [Byssovorax sp.]
MQRLGLRARLVLASVMLTLVAGLVVERLTSRELEGAMLTRMRLELQQKITLLEDDLSRGDPALASAVTRRFAEHAGARVTLVDEAGRVLADSGVPDAQLASLENHAAREEIAEARAKGLGTAIRTSPTLGTRMIYVAKREPPSGAAAGAAYVRLALPLDDVDRAIAGARSAVALGIAAALTIAALLFGVGAHAITAPIRGLTDAARAMADGELDARAPARGKDEVAMLGRALNALAAQLSRTIDELRADRDVLTGILDGMSEGVLLLDDDLDVVLANRALRAIARLDDDAIGRHVSAVLRSASLLDAVDSARAGLVPATREVELGGVITRRLLVRLSRLPGTEHGALLAVFHDVTDLRRLETIRTDFVANVSHELRTPVTAIGTAAETLLGGALGDAEAAREFVEVIDRHSARLKHLVDDLLDLAKIEAKGFRLTIGDVDLAPVVEQAVRLLEPTARRRKVRVEALVPGDLPRVRVDPRGLEQVVSNLLDNAIKYGGEGARVRVTAKVDDGGAVEIAVSDDGPGIAPAHLTRVFERFYRVDAGRSRELGGTGLGLSIVKHMTELMHGTVGVESEPGHGATFRVRVPAVAA